jgi:hypothetical protein
MDRNNYQYGGDVYEKYLSYLNQLESKDPLSSEVLPSQPNTYVASSGDGVTMMILKQVPHQDQALSIGNAISNAISSMTTPKGIGSADRRSCIWMTWSVGRKSYRIIFWW